MHMDPLILYVSAAVFLVLLVGAAAKRLKQPNVVGYLIAGVVMGPFGLGLLTDVHLLTTIGALGVVLLIFFVGMELEPKELIANWRVAIFGTTLQITFSVAAVGVLGWALEWPLARTILVGFVISLSSTAVVFKLLSDFKEQQTATGRQVSSILLTQDLALIPMMIIIALVGGATPSAAEVSLQVVGGILLMALFVWLIRAGEINLPMLRFLQDDKEMQVFAALGMCFGLALITGLFNLSSALGAFLAGMLVAASRGTRWIHHSLLPFHVVFVAVFFVSIGMLVDLKFLLDEWPLILTLVFIALVINSVINAGALRLLGVEWRPALYAGALLAQIGEFSFVLAAVGRQADIISDYGYSLAIEVIAISLIVSPIWITTVKKLTGN